MPKIPSVSYIPRNRGAWLFALLLIAIISTDQYTKSLARKMLETSRDIAVIGDLIQFSLIENYGGFLGVVSKLPETTRFFLLNTCVLCLLLACLAYLFLYNKRSIRYAFPLVFVTGGGMSNLLDRLFHSGGVTDFVSIGVGGLRTGIFNLADVYILAGSFAIGFSLFYSSTPSKHLKQADGAR